ncbi:hypothetical protein J8J27_21790, partial [Mycobacterium tuberculosis]|nr:hypothetical protein [Mycobacterium tuberculosis]
FAPSFVPRAPAAAADDDPWATAPQQHETAAPRRAEPAPPPRQGGIAARAMGMSAAPAYLDRHGRPRHPRDLLGHTCLRARFRSGALSPWEFERDGEEVRVDPTGPLVVQAGAASDLTLAAGLAGGGIVHMFEGWLRPHLDAGTLEPVLEDWWQSFPGPFLYYP